MIDLYTFATPNGQKASIALEELELPCTVHVVNIALSPWLVSARNFYPELFRSLTGIPQGLERVGARPALQRGMKVPQLTR